MDPNYNSNVFINCPFDIDYTKNLHVIVFTVYSCGFFAVQRFRRRQRVRHQVVQN